MTKTDFDNMDNLFDLDAFRADREEAEREKQEEEETEKKAFEDFFEKLYPKCWKFDFHEFTGDDEYNSETFYCRSIDYAVSVIGDYFKNNGIEDNEVVSYQLDGGLLFRVIEPEQDKAYIVHLIPFAFADM